MIGLKWTRVDVVAPRYTLNYMGFHGLSFEDIIVYASLMELIGRYRVVATYSGGHVRR